MKNEWKQILDDTLCDAQSLYGDQVSSVYISDIRTASGGPNIYFPVKGDYDNVEIILSDSCKTDDDQAQFQIAHEVIHCLGPSEQAMTTVLEEGLAVLFSDDYYSKGKMTYYTGPNETNYLQAKQITQSLLSLNSNGIKELRAIDPRLSHCTFAHLKKVFPNATNNLLNQALDKFYK